MAQDSSLASAITPLVWKRVVHLQDGRTFVSDGAIALEASVARQGPSRDQSLPEASAKVVESCLNAELPHEFTLSQLTRSGEHSYTDGDAVMLNATYVDYLRRTVPEAHCE